MYTDDQPAETTFEIQAESSEIELGNHSLSLDFFPLFFHDNVLNFFHIQSTQYSGNTCIFTMTELKPTVGVVVASSIVSQNRCLS